MGSAKNSQRVRPILAKQIRIMNNTVVLIVDNDPNFASTARWILSHLGGFTVHVECHSTEALATARKVRPSVIILDVDMPIKDGGEVAREIQSDASLKKVPILFLTSLLDSRDDGTQPVIRGGMPFLAKPVDAQVLIKSVRGLLEVPAVA